MSFRDSTSSRGALASGASSSACPASAHSRPSSRALAAISRRCAELPGTVSVMPSGLDQQLTPQELADLLAFLRACK